MSPSLEGVFSTIGSSFSRTLTFSFCYRKKRDAYNSTIPEQQLLLLHNYVDTFSEMPNSILQQDMVAKYLECGLGQQYDSPSLQGCLQKLSCIVQAPEVQLEENERQVAEM